MTLGQHVGHGSDMCCAHLCLAQMVVSGFVLVKNGAELVAHGKMRLRKVELLCTEENAHVMCSITTRRPPSGECRVVIVFYSCAHCTTCDCNEIA